MATAKYRDSRIRTAQKLLARIKAKRTDAEEYLVKSEELIADVEGRIEWLKSMPIDDAPAEEVETSG